MKYFNDLQEGVNAPNIIKAFFIAEDLASGEDISVLIHEIKINKQRPTKSNGSSKRFIYPIKEIIKVIIFSAINLLSIRKELIAPYFRSTVNEMDLIKNSMKK